MTGKLTITNKVGDDKITEIARKREAELLAAGINTLNIAWQGEGDGREVTITPSNSNPHLKVDKKTADEAMGKLNEDLIAGGFKARVVGMKMPVNEILIKQKRTFSP